MLACRRLASHAGGEPTAERADAVDSDAVTVVAVRRAMGSRTGGVYHTVSTSTPTEKRLARVRFRGNKDGQAVVPLPPRGVQRLHEQFSQPQRRYGTAGSSHVGVRARSNQDDEDDEEAFWSDTELNTRASVDQEAKRDEQRAGEDTLTRSAAAECSYSNSDASSLVFSVERTRVASNGGGGGGGNNVREDIVSRIATLKVLLDEGFLTPQEYERRKLAIVDELTFASSRHSSVRKSELRSESRTTITPRNGMPQVVPHVPDFRHITPEVSTKHVFDYDTREWSTSQVYVALDETPFSKGSLRVVYHLQDLNELSFTGSYVAKVAIDPDEDPQTYFRDIELQAHCAYYANLYNSYYPPKRVEFLQAWVLELSERAGVLCAVEEYIPGDYRKHNNNFGSVSDDERNTPQAFSHFTYEASNHELLAVDIQGVGDKYTDPQLHTLNGYDFGKGNLGVLGFQKFLSSHRCNSICRYLKLPPVNPKDRHNDRGTLPLQELMNRDRVRPTSFDSKHYYEHAPMLQKYVTHCRELEERHTHDRDRDGASRRDWGDLLLCSSRVPLCGGCSIQ